MDDVDGCTGDGGIGDHLMQGSRDAGVALRAVTHVDKARPLPFGGEFEDMLEFLLHGLGRVAEAEADAETALRESLFDEIADGLLFAGCRGLALRRCPWATTFRCRA